SPPGSTRPRTWSVVISTAAARAAEYARVEAEVVLHVRAPVKRGVVAGVRMPFARDAELRERVGDTRGRHAPRVDITAVDVRGVGLRELGLGLDERERIARREVRTEAEIRRRVTLWPEARTVRPDRRPDAGKVQRELHRAMSAHREAADGARVLSRK